MEICKKRGMDVDGKEAIQEIKEKLASAEKLLIGLGAEWKDGGSAERMEQIRQAAAALRTVLEGKDYFVISTLAGEDLSRLELENSHMAAPLDVSFTEEQWQAYTDWLGRTLNRKLVILELGEGFLNPGVIRWPFEKTAAINQKAFLYRINRKLYQIPDELKGRAAAVAADSVEFMTLWTE